MICYFAQHIIIFLAMDYFKKSQILQELKQELKHNLAKINIGHDVPQENIDDLKNRISKLEKELFSGNVSNLS